VRATAGSFDPTLLTGVIGLGPARWWSGRDGEATTTLDHTNGRSDWIDETIVDADGLRIRLPAGVQLDGGAIGKGLAADLVAADLLAWGATGVRVVVGGDLRVVSPSVIAVRAPGWDGVIDHVAIADGGLATSGTGPAPGGVGHRGRPVVDPRTGCPVSRVAAPDIVQVSVATRAAADAEVLATAILVDGFASRDRLVGEAAVLAVRADGRLVANAAWRALRCPRGIGVAS
jgi:thiamine biosynthesis lipoprotein